MSNTLSHTKKHQSIIKFKPGDIVDARGQIGVIVDVLRSGKTENICLYVRFAHNLGNARKYDMLEISPDRTFGVEKWGTSTLYDLDRAVDARLKSIHDEAGNLFAFCREQAGEHR